MKSFTISRRAQRPRSTLGWLACASIERCVFLAPVLIVMIVSLVGASGQVSAMEPGIGVEVEPERSAPAPKKMHSEPRATEFAAPTSAIPAICSNPPNAIVAENCLPGNPSSDWQVYGAGDPTLQGFATDISFNLGSMVAFKVNDTAAAPYHIDIYRMGYYGGNGARLITTIPSSQTLEVAQPACASDATTGLVDCGNWSVTAAWTIPTGPGSSPSGIYIATPVREDTGGESQMIFVVRDDASTSPVLFQTSDTTWHAYNDFGGNSLYIAGPGTNPGRAYKVSYNRPFGNRANALDGYTTHDFVFYAEYPMVRWLEANGYDVRMHRASTATATARSFSTTGRSCRSGTTNTGQPASGLTSRRRETPA
jgi:hypothetical protein